MKSHSLGGPNVRVVMFPRDDQFLVVLMISVGQYLNIQDR